MKQTFVIHDVLQTRLFSKSQLKALEEKTMLNWFTDMVIRLPKRKLKLAIIAEGVASNKEWVDFIKINFWEVQCHGWEHKVMHLMEEDAAFEELRYAKDVTEETFHQKVTQFYPPKHKISDNLIRASHRAGMNIMLDRFRPIHVLEGTLAIPEIYIHYWNKSNVDEALRLI